GEIMDIVHMKELNARATRRNLFQFARAFGQRLSIWRDKEYAAFLIAKKARIFRI
ncbi:Hypothetical protein FKW44_010694, partial [Caligus rogercresseyi]